MKQEMKQQIQQNAYKRLSAKEHSDRVRFDPNQAIEKIKGNKYKLIYPKDAPGADPALYEKMQEKATKIWKAATGTYNPQKPSQKDAEEKDKAAKPKKKKKKKPKVLAPKDDDGVELEKQKSGKMIFPRKIDENVLAVN